MAYIQKECSECGLIYSFDEDKEINCPRCNGGGMPDEPKEENKPLTMDEVEDLLTEIPETNLDEVEEKDFE